VEGSRASLIMLASGCIALKVLGPVARTFLRSLLFRRMNSERPDAFFGDRAGRASRLSRVVRAVAVGTLCWESAALFVGMPGMAALATAGSVFTRKRFAELTAVGALRESGLLCQWSRE
jgi:hypothetical protein